MTIFQRLLLALSVVAGFSTPAAAQLAVNVTGGNLFQRGTFQNFGWAFTLDQTREVGALGLYDYLGDGLTDEHQIGLWDSSNNLLATAMISSADSQIAAVGGGWRFENIPSLMLGPGTYVVGAHYPTVGAGTDFFIGQATYTTASGLTFIDSRVTVGAINGFAEPTSSSAFGADGYFGPNLMFVPEPSSWAMLIAGFGLIGSVMRRRQPRLARAAS